MIFCCESVYRKSLWENIHGDLISEKNDEVRRGKNYIDVE